MTDVAHEPPGDAELVAEAYVLRRGGPEAFEVFYAREMPRLVTLARALCGAATAEDVAQEAMLVAYRRWAEIAGLDRPEAWVRRVCANLSTSTVRRRVVEARSLLRLGTRPDAPQVLGESTEEFWALVRRLPRRQAQTVALRYVYDLDVAQISTTLGCSEGTTKTQLFRARETLRRQLQIEETES